METCGGVITGKSYPTVSPCGSLVAFLASHAASAAEVHLAVTSGTAGTLQGCIRLVTFAGAMEAVDGRDVFDLLRFSCVWAPDGNELFAVLGTVNMLYAVSLRPELCIRKQSQILQLGTVDATSLRVNSAGEFLVLKLQFRGNSVISVLRTVDLCHEVTMRAPTHCRSQGRQPGNVLCFEWDSFEQSHRNSPCQSNETGSAERSALGLSGAVFESVDCIEICRFGKGMLLCYFHVQDSRECSIVWHDITSNCYCSQRVGWCSDCRPSDLLSTVLCDKCEHRSLHVNFDGRWAFLESSCGQFCYIDTAVLVSFQGSAQDREQKLCQAVATAYLDVTYGSCHHVRAGFRGSYGLSGHKPLLVLKDVSFHESMTDSRGSHDDWLMAIDGDSVVPELKLSCLQVPYHSIYANKIEYLQTLGYVNCKRVGCLKIDFPRQFSCFPPNERTLDSWLKRLDAKIAPKSHDVQVSPCCGIMEHEMRSYASWMDLLACQAPETLAIIVASLPVFQKVVLIFAYPHLACHILENRESAHALVISWACLPWSSVPRVLHKDSTWWGYGYSDLTLEVLKVLTELGDIDAHELVQRAFENDFVGGSRRIFLRSEDCTAAEAFAKRLRWLKQTPHNLLPWAQHRCQKCFPELRGDV